MSVELANGYLGISGHQSGVTIGSIEGDGVVSLGANDLTVGTNNMNTVFSGFIGGSGSLAKVGMGYSLCKPTTPLGTPSV